MKRSSGRAAVILGSSWRKLPAAALRGLMKLFSPRAVASLLKRSKPANGMNTSPRTSSTRGGRAARNFKRQGLDGPEVLRDVLAGFAVAARRTLHEHAVLIAGADGQTVQFRFCRITNGVLSAQPFPVPAIEVAHLNVAERIVQRQHGEPMFHRSECGDRRRPHSLRGRIWCQQLGMLRLQGSKFEHETVVFGIRNFRIIEGVIAVVVAFQRLFELGDARCRLGRTRCFLRAHLSNSVRATPGNARCLRAKRPRAAATTAFLWRPAPCPPIPGPTPSPSRRAHPSIREAAGAPAKRRTM